MILSADYRQCKRQRQPDNRDDNSHKSRSDSRAAKIAQCKPSFKGHFYRGFLQDFQCKIGLVLVRHECQITILLIQTGNWLNFVLYCDALLPNQSLSLFFKFVIQLTDNIVRDCRRTPLKTITFI